MEIISYRLIKHKAVLLFGNRRPAACKNFLPPEKRGFDKRNAFSAQNVKKTDKKKSF